MPRIFEIGSYVAWVLTAIAIATVFKNKREYWYAFLGLSTLIFFEWFADFHWMFYRYSDKFTFIFSHHFVPLFMFFAYGWFFGLMLIVNLQFEEKLDRLPFWGQVLLLYAIYFVWDFIVEFTFTQTKCWTYYNSAPSLKNMPWIIPCIVAVASTGFYFIHKWARKYSVDKSWFKGFLIHVSFYWGFFGLFGAVGWVFMKIVGIHSTIPVTALHP